MNEHVAIMEPTRSLPLNSPDCQKITLSMYHTFCDECIDDKVNAAPHLSVSWKENIRTII